MSKLEIQGSLSTGDKLASEKLIDMPRRHSAITSACIYEHKMHAVHPFFFFFFLTRLNGVHRGRLVVVQSLGLCFRLKSPPLSCLASFLIRAAGPFVDER